MLELLEATKRVELSILSLKTTKAGAGVTFLRRLQATEAFPMNILSSISILL
jgi:hypothetical protein